MILLDEETRRILSRFCDGYYLCFIFVLDNAPIIMTPFVYDMNEVRPMNSYWENEKCITILGM